MWTSPGRACSLSSTIISMFKILSVTNRHLCREPLWERAAKIARAGADGIILREKDLEEGAYEALSRQVLEGCGDKLILHSFPETAERLNLMRLHLPLPVLRTLSLRQREAFAALGGSCHSLRDVKEAEDLGCTYVTLGHIFATDCKKGLPPRGLDFLEETAKNTRLTLYAIGGIGRENIRLIREAGASGACIMSGLMVCEAPEQELAALRNALR